MFKPMQLIINRVEAHGADSDSTLFTELLYAGEFIVKATTSAMVALIQNDREGQQYRLLHSLVRADGIGDWAAALDQALSGPASQHLVSSAQDMRRIFTERSVAGSWQWRCVKDLYSVLAGIDPEATAPADRPQLRSWFQLFAQLRNKTRGHGALTPAAASRFVKFLQDSILLMAENNPVLNEPWAYLHRNLSGKYRVVSLGGDQAPFIDLKKAKGALSDNFPPGIYIYFSGHRQVELLRTDLNISDFFASSTRRMESRLPGAGIWLQP
ncbi:MAG: hypothetical protein GC191_12880 [Azospirillum sp.]|nr:hypothetical protein [Azospirillum sp.]